jgi:hypothetical protein
MPVIEILPSEICTIMLPAMRGTDEIGTASLLIMASAALLVYGIEQSA